MTKDNISYYFTRIDNKSRNSHFLQPNYAKHNNNKKFKNNKCNQVSSITSNTSSLKKYEVAKQPIQINEPERKYKFVETNIKITSKFHQALDIISKQFKKYQDHISSKMTRKKSCTKLKGKYHTSNNNQKSIRSSTSYIQPRIDQDHLLKRTYTRTK